MSQKEIVGFENRHLKETNNDICPNCNHRTMRIPIGITIQKNFFSERKIEYTCDKCGCVWRV